jgi:hypothetical protein
VKRRVDLASTQRKLSNLFALFLDRFGVSQRFRFFHDLVKEITEHIQGRVDGHDRHLAGHVADIAGELR